MSITKTARTAIFMLLCALLYGCGFSLRGNDAISDNLPALRLNAAQANGEFVRQLRTSLLNANVELVAMGAVNAPLLSLSAERMRSTPVSVNPRARATQYELRLEVDIELQGPGISAIPMETLFSERSLFEDIENISGNLDEVEILTNEMRRDLINQLLRRLQNSGAQP